MSIAAIQELVAKQCLDDELISHFINTDAGTVTLRFESEYWDYKRQMFDLDSGSDVAELAADVLAFHNTRGGYIIVGITDDFVVLGVHEGEALKCDSNQLNAKLKRYIGQTFYCRYSPISLQIGGTRKTLAVIFIPPRQGLAIATQQKAANNLFKEGQFFIRANDRRKRAESDAEFALLYNPPEPDVIVGSHQLKTYSPRPGTRLFLGDYTRFVGEVTRQPLIDRVIEELVYGKWDVILLRGVGGVGKTALAIEATKRLATDADYVRHFGGIISLSAKAEELTPYDRRPIHPEILSFDQFLRQIIINSDWDGDVPGDVAEKERLAVKLLQEKHILLFVDNFETIETRESRISEFLTNLPSGSKVLVTSRHQPTTMPAYPIVVWPLDTKEAEILALAEATVQHVDTAITDRFLPDIVKVSGNIPLAIKWIISCSKNADHLLQLIDDHRRGKPALANLCEFCFTFEYNLLSGVAKKALAVFPLFQRAPSLRELAVAAGVEDQPMRAAIEELIDFSLVVREYNQVRDEEVFRILQLTASFAASKLKTLGDLDRQARRRLKIQFGPSLPMLLRAAEEMISRKATSAARQYIDEEILERDPGNADALFLRGQTYELELFYTAAIQDYEKAIASVGAQGALAAEVALRLLSLSRHDSRPRESLLPVLELAFRASEDVRIASALAKTFEMQNKLDEARNWYRKVFLSYSFSRQDLWDEAVVFLIRDVKDSHGDKAGLDLTREALRMCPSSKVASHWEKKIMEELGLIKVRSSLS